MNNELRDRFDNMASKHDQDALKWDALGPKILSEIDQKKKKRNTKLKSKNMLRSSLQFLG